MSTEAPPTSPRVEVSPEAREALLAHVARDPERHRFVRVHVGRG